MQFLGVKFSEKRIFGLDILRAIAILTVVYGHGKTYAYDFVSPKAYNFFRFDGVSAFFVLSGFLIGGILIRTLENTDFTKKDLLNFWLRRWFRTLPNYVFIVLLLAIIHLTIGHQINQLYLFPLFLQNFLVADNSFFIESWSLAVEEWFYLLTPLLIYIFIRGFKLKARYALLTTIIAIILASILARLYRYYTFDIDQVNELGVYIRKVVVTRLDSIMYGVLGAYIYHYYPKTWAKYKIPLFIIGLYILFKVRILSLFIAPDAHREINFGINTIVILYLRVPIGVLFTLPFLNSIKSGKGVLYKFITYISIVSYALYVVHLSLVKETVEHYKYKFVPEWFTDKQEAILLYTTYWVVSLVVATLLYKYYEKPMTNLRERFSKPQKN